MKTCQKCGRKYSDQASDEKDVSDPDNNNNNNNNNNYNHHIGKLRLVQSFMGHVDDEMDPINELNICPECGPIFNEDDESEKKDMKTRKSKEK
jgi:hypothetical protein